MFDNIREPINPPLSQFDAGINCDTDYVPIFDLENGHEGENFPMLLEGWGSVCLPLTTSEQYEVTLKCYPRVVHVLKASRIMMKISNTNRGMRSKIKSIRSFIDDIVDNTLVITRYKI